MRLLILANILLLIVSDQAIQYLEAEYQPTRSQSPGAITQLITALGKYDLTKAEKLQIVNLAPQQLVELYVVRSIIILIRVELASVTSFVDSRGNRRATWTFCNGRNNWISKIFCL